MDKRIAKILGEAQICSDIGKDFNVTRKVTRGWRAEQAEDFYKLSKLIGETARKKAYHGGYARKEHLINEACGRIARNPECGFHFWVGKDSYGKAVVYFQWKLSDGRHQASFHMPNGAELWEKGCHGSISYWARKGSRKELIQLLESL